MHELHVFLGLLVAVLLVVVAGRRLRLPPVVALVLGGLAFGALPFTPEIEVDPELILLVFLPPILFPAAFAFANADLRALVRPIAFLAIGLVLATMAAVAVVAHVVLGVPWAVAFVLGAALSPTDPVAAAALMRSAGAPERITDVLEGESLINDGTALTALGVAIAAVGSGHVTVPSAALDFVVVAFGGLGVGVALGWIASALRTRIDDVEVELAASVLLAYGAFSIGEGIGVSGILATVATGWVMGRTARHVGSPLSRVRGVAFWAVLRFLAESILFLLIGVSFATVMSDPAGRDGLVLLGAVLAVAAAIVGVRFLWIFSVTPLLRIADHRLERVQPVLPRRHLVLVAAGGMRGAVSVAAALTIPMTVADGVFPERQSLIVVTVGTVILTLVVPALVFPVLLRRLGFTGPEGMPEQERAARVRLAHAALARINDLEVFEQAPAENVRRARERYEWRIARLGGGDASEAPADDGSLSYLAMRRELLDAERKGLEELHRDGEVTGEALRAIEHDLDVEETRLDGGRT